MYSRHKCFSSILELPKPCIHSSRNSSVRWGSLAARVSLIDLIKMVLLAGIHNPEIEGTFPFKVKLSSSKEYLVG